MKSDVQLNLRAKESQRALIDAAAEILHKSRTDFILEMACKAAENVILDRRVFTLMVGLLRIHFNVASSLAVMFQPVDI